MQSTEITETKEATELKDPWKDKYGYDIPRCSHISSTGARCNAAPQTGQHFCYFHDPDKQEERLESQRAGGRNRRRPEPPLVIPPGLPRLSLQTPTDIAALFEETINFVRTGEMDLRVAS